MPTTVNGIGTHYYGKSNPTERQARCGSCNRFGVLQSYNTRLWFVIVFIPIIPLKRKRIIDQCPACRRHMVADADKYEQARQLQTSASLDEFRRDPSVASALEAHAQLLIYREYEQATEFRASVLERYPDDAELRASLAAHLDQMSAYDEARVLYQDALNLDRDLPTAKVGVARGKMASGELDEARKLLRFLEEPGVGRHESLNPLDVLSDCYQKQGRHEEAMELAVVLLRELPNAGQIHAFRAFVKRSEKALGRFDTILPPAANRIRGLFQSAGSPYSKNTRTWLAAGLIVGVIGAGLLASNEYIRRHRAIHVLNACGAPVQVVVDNQAPRTFNLEGTLSLPEGHHQVKVTGPANETYDLDISSTFFSRWGSSPFWALVPGGERPLEVATVHYAQNPRAPEYRLIAGETFVNLPQVDYLFTEPPDKLSVKDKSNEITKVVVSRFEGGDLSTFLGAWESSPENALTFAEHRLRRDPGQVALLKAYVDRGEEYANDRLVKFLESGLDHRPVVIPWHRAYQQHAESDEALGQLTARYDKALAETPDDAALLYLRGRLEPEWAREEGFYRRAIAADPQSPWPWLALAVHNTSEARWDDAIQDLSEARARKIDEDIIADGWHVANLGVGRAEALISEYRDHLKEPGSDVQDMVRLADALAAAGQTDQVEPEINAWIGRMPMTVQTNLAQPLRTLGLYLTGRVEDCEAQCRATVAPWTGSLLAQAMLAQGHAEEAAADPRVAAALADDPFTMLAVSLGLSLAGKTEPANDWRGRAVQKLEKTGFEGRRFAKVLASDGPTPIEELANIHVEPARRALILATLAARFPDASPSYREAAARFNLGRRAPYLLVRRATEGPGAASP